MRGRFTIIRNQMLLKDNSIGSHLYINIVMLWIFFFIFQKYYVITFLHLKRRKV